MAARSRSSIWSRKANGWRNGCIFCPRWPGCGRSPHARRWKIGAAGQSWEQTPDGWLRTARDNQQRLLTLLDVIHEHPLREPTGDYDSLVEYDRRRVLKEQLLFTIIGTCLDMSLAIGALQGAEGGSAESAEEGAAEWEPFAIRLEQALFAGEAAAARAVLPAFLDKFQSEPLLFTPLTEGGTPRQILRVRVAQTILRALLANLPRLGLLRETYDLLRTARAMEQAQPMRGRGVTEFNHFFQAAYQAVVESVVESAPTWGRAPRQRRRACRSPRTLDRPVPDAVDRA